MTARSTSRDGEVEAEAIKGIVEEAKLAERDGRWSDASIRSEQLVRNPFADDVTRLSALGWLGRAYLELGNRGAAMDVLEAAVAAATQAGSASAIAQALNVVAIIHQTGGDLDLAESRYTEARITAQSIGDAEALAMIDQNLGTVASIRGDIRRALEAFKRSLDGYRALGRRDQAAQVLNNIGLAYSDLGQLYWTQKRHRDMLANLNESHALYSRLKAQHRVAQVERRNAALESRFLEMAHQWGDSIESKDQYTQGHCQRVAFFACVLADSMGMDAQSLFWFRLGALLHDIGKIIVPTEVLNKAGDLTEEEWAIMKRHPEAGLELVADIDFPGDVRAIIRNHHERWDGTGYPDGLKGEQIPFAARILCVADVYDALTTARSYRDSLPHARAAEVMRASTGQFDPNLLESFLGWASSTIIPGRQTPQNVAAFSVGSPP